MATVGKLTVNELIANSDIQGNQLAITSDVQFSGPVVCSDIVYLDGGANSDLVTGLNADMFDGAQLDTDVTMVADTDVEVPTQHAVKTYADTLVAGATVVHTSGDETIAGTKTFSTDIVGDIDGGIVEQGTGGATLKVKVIDIGVWNMDSTVSVSIAHGLTVANIRMVSIMVKYDDDDWWYPIQKEGTDGYFYVNATNVLIGRAASGGFDSAFFDSTAFSRGKITIWYEA